MNWENNETVNNIGTVSSTTDESTAHVEELLTKSYSNINETQIDSLQSLLYEYKDQFSKSSLDLGSRHLIEHTIKTLRDCKPVKLRPYMIPLDKRDFAENEIKAMAEKGLI